MRIRTYLVIALATASLAACGGKKSGGTTTGGTPPAGDTLYARLGGEPVVKAVVKDFVEEEVLKDNRINAFFKGVDGAHLEQMLFEQICGATGGGCTYSGKDMKTAHMNMGVADADFTALVEDLTKSLDKFKVHDKDKNDLLTALAAMKPDIVTQ